MRMIAAAVATISLAGLLCAIEASAADSRYTWLERYDGAQALAERIAPPRNFERAPLEGGSFGAWLRGLPLKPGRPEVLLFDGRRKRNQDAHHAVVDIDVGRRDLQQCADAVMRLWAEYHYSRGAYESIRFKDGAGKLHRFGSADRSRASFRKYLDRVFGAVGSHALAQALRPVRLKEMAVGDVLIKGGFPGHAVIVVDMAVERGTGRRAYLLAQSYMPAQDVHVLKNPQDRAASPWYLEGPESPVFTPEWDFQPDQLKRFDAQR